MFSWRSGVVVSDDLNDFDKSRRHGKNGWQAFLTNKMKGESSPTYSTKRNMAICEKCGKEIPEGGVCDCDQIQADPAAAPETAAPAENAAFGGDPAADVNADAQAIDPNAQSPYNEAQPVGDNVQVIDENGQPQGAAASLNGVDGVVNSFKQNPKMLLLLLIPVAVVFLAVVIIVLTTILGGGGYKKPLKDFQNGYNSNNCEKMLTAMLPSDAIKELKDELKDDEDMSWKEAMDTLNDLVKESKEDDYGRNAKMTIKVTSHSKVDRDDLRSLRSYYDSMTDKQIDKAVKVKVRISIKGRDDSDTTRTSMYVVHFKNDGWKMSGYSSDVDDLLPSLSSLYY